MSELATNTHERGYRVEADKARANRKLGHALRREALRNMVVNAFKPLNRYHTAAVEVDPSAVAKRLTDLEEGRPHSDPISTWLGRYMTHIQQSEPTRTFRDKADYVEELRIATIDQAQNEAGQEHVETTPLPNHIALALGRFIAHETPDSNQVIENGQIALTTPEEPDSLE